VFAAWYFRQLPSCESCSHGRVNCANLLTAPNTSSYKFLIPDLEYLFKTAPSLVIKVFLAPLGIQRSAEDVYTRHLLGHLNRRHFKTRGTSFCVLLLCVRIWNGSDTKSRTLIILFIMLMLRLDRSGAPSNRSILLLPYKGPALAYALPAFCAKNMASMTWLITGCSSGFGFSLAYRALQAGHHVVASSRNPSKTPELVQQIEKAGGKWVALDVTFSPEQLQKIVNEYQIDVLVNNAGYSVLGAVEDISDAQAHSQMETNFFGPLKLTQAVLPGMRERRKGTIVNISSIAGLDGLPTCGLYAG